MPSERSSGQPEQRTDCVAPRLVQALAATLDLDLAAIAPDGLLPPLWHWLLFQDWTPASGLGPDGHARRGGFLPADPALPHRLWGGGRVAFLRPLHLGETVRRVSAVEAVSEKAGSSGRLLMVTVRHLIHGADGPAIEEAHDIVFHGISAAAAPRAADVAAPLAAGAFTAQLTPDAVLLFRYSALTGNAHRIHYDLDHVRAEGYPGLLVHGPLQATLLAGLLHRHLPGRRLARFAFRARRPAFHGRRMTLAGHAEGALVRLQTRDDEGHVCMTAEAALV